MADTDQVLNLAAIIRKVDGNHSKGAAALAESILDHPGFRAVLAGEPAVPEGKKPTRDELWELWLRLNNELPDRPAAVAEFWEHAQINARARAALSDEPAVPEVVGSEWQPCVKLPITVHVREQRPGEQHVSTREGITPVQSDDLIMLGVDGEEYPIGRELFQRTYRMGSADEPVMPEGREPASVTGEPSDEEIMGLMPQQMHEDLAAAVRAMAEQQGIDSTPAKGAMRIILNRHVVDLARAVLARWGHQPAPPADGEVAELAAWLQDSAAKCKRAAELLQRHVVVPVAVSERLPEAGDCDAEGRCWWRSHAVGGPYWHLWHRQRWTPIDTHWLPAHALPLPEVSE